MRILYVEDNPANLFLVQRVARMGNHEVINYSEGQIALDNFKRDNPDLVLMDVQLPGKLTGLDVVKALRDAGHKTPIVAVTAYAMIGDRERCLQVGCNAYIAKPLPVAELVEMIKHYEGLLAPGSIPAPASASTPAAPSAPVSVPKPAEAPVPAKPVEAAAASPEVKPETAPPAATPTAEAEKSPAPPQAANPPPAVVEAKPATETKSSSEAAEPEKAVGVGTPVPSSQNTPSTLSSNR